jgi:hypothetical protein
MPVNWKLTAATQSFNGLGVQQVVDKIERHMSVAR